MLTKQEVVDMLADSDQISDWTHAMYHKREKMDATEFLVIANKAISEYGRIIQTILERLDETKKKLRLQFPFLILFLFH